VTGGGAPGALRARVAEADLLPLSALQHFVFCERQAALIHVERVWLDNVWTIEGEHLHEKVVSGESESRGEVRTGRDVPLRSLGLGLSGRADVVEFHRTDRGPPIGARVRSWPALWRPFPVEYKRGKPKGHRADEVQLCAQALCLEEMLGVEIAGGALFYGKIRHRREVAFDRELRDVTVNAAWRFRQMFERGQTPPAVYEAWKCQECSLLEVCRPRATRRRVDRYLRGLAESSTEGRGP
jgi:CRISPR-associated exonuclease Cas4